MRLLLLVLAIGLQTAKAQSPFNNETTQLIQQVIDEHGVIVKKMFAVAYDESVSFLQMGANFSTAVTEGCYEINLQQDEFLWQWQGILARHSQYEPAVRHLEQINRQIANNIIRLPEGQSSFILVANQNHIAGHQREKSIYFDGVPQTEHFKVIVDLYNDQGWCIKLKVVKGKSGQGYTMR